MGFKSDREFLRNVTIGAVGTRKVASILNDAGYQIIELERYSTSNKIWATRIKRLRVPDLLCIRSGTRIESRAKSTLKMAMSHAISNPERAWDKGLRESDLVAFIQCSEASDGSWIAADRLSLFRVGELRENMEAAGLTQMKAASEGSEVQLVWPAVVPKQSGTVTAIAADHIQTQLESGRRQRYRLAATRGQGTAKRQHRLFPYVSEGSTFVGGAEIIASVIPNIVSLTSPTPSPIQYDFVKDLNSDEHETVYAAAKALGFLPAMCSKSIGLLRELSTGHENPLLRLECAAALARLSIDEGWQTIESALGTGNESQTRMEAVLVLGELKSKEALALLDGVASDAANDPELRAAAVWNMAETECGLLETPLISFFTNPEEVVAVHAVVASSRLIGDGCLRDLLGRLGQNDQESACIVRAILASTCDPVGIVVEMLPNANDTTRKWLLYLLASLGRRTCESVLDSFEQDTLDGLEFHWKYHRENWTNRFDVADQINFQLAQVLD